jgi:hypothetical protein
LALALLGKVMMAAVAVVLPLAGHTVAVVKALPGVHHLTAVVVLVAQEQHLLSRVRP